MRSRLGRAGVSVATVSDVMTAPACVGTARQRPAALRPAGRGLSAPYGGRRTAAAQPGGHAAGRASAGRPPVPGAESGPCERWRSPTRGTARAGSGHWTLRQLLDPVVVAGPWIAAVVSVSARGGSWSGRCGADRSPCRMAIDDAEQGERRGALEPRCRRGGEPLSGADADGPSSGWHIIFSCFGIALPPADRLHRMAGSPAAATPSSPSSRTPGRRRWACSSPRARCRGRCSASRWASSGRA